MDAQRSRLRAPVHQLFYAPVAVLVGAANGFQHLNRAQFPAFVRTDDTRARSRERAGGRTPFNVWFVGDEPVALVEQYVP